MVQDSSQFEDEKESCIDSVCDKCKEIVGKMYNRNEQKPKTKTCFSKE